MPTPDHERRSSDIAEAVAFFLAVLAYLWWLAIPFPWAGVLIVLAVFASWRRRGLNLAALGLGWTGLRASAARWRWVWVVAAATFVTLGGSKLLTVPAVSTGAIYFAWAAVQQVVYQSMTYLPLRSCMKSRALAAALGGAAFAVMHVPNPVLVPATFVWGTASSLLFDRCRSVWGLALLQMMFSSSLFWATPREWNRDFQIGPYYARMASQAAPASTFAPPAAAR